MSVSPVLPEDFDGTFRFTNWTDEDFVGKWGSKEYRFPARTTSPIIITSATPLEIQQIRKKFAKDLAEREFGKSQEYQKFMSQEKNSDGSPRLNSIHQAASYSIETLTPYIQKCLEPLSLARATITDIPMEPMESKLTRNQDGELNSIAVDKKISLKKKALDA